MTTFEALVLVFYMSFAFGYMVNVFGIDVYNKLNDYGKEE